LDGFAPAGFRETGTRVRLSMRETRAAQDTLPPHACGKIATHRRNQGKAGCRPRRLRHTNTPRPNGSRIMYQSDITQFINQLKEQKPSLEEEQRRGRALLWDKQPIDLDERSKQQQSRVNQTPYVYYQNF
jgi:hypothetical protein